MPVYEYECPTCLKVVEIFRLISDREVLPICFETGCGGNEMRLIISKNSFSLKGQGWARDGYSKR